MQPSLLVVTDWPLRDGWESEMLTRTLMREGIRASDIKWLSVLSSRPYAGQMFRASAEDIAGGRARITEALSSGEPLVVLSCGEFCLELTGGVKGIDKWQASILRPHPSVTVVPTFAMERVAQDLSLQMWVALSCRKVAGELKSPTKEPKYDFLLNPPLAETLDYLRDCVAKADLVSVDIETGRGQINTVGFAVGPNRAIAINVLAERVGGANHYALWKVIAGILEGPQPKILQNYIYETLFFSRYGIRLNNVHHDTMIAQKFLWPEFEMGLDAVGRMYTPQKYWKDDGKSWNNIRDWERHYEYNCKDTVGTFAGYQGQVKDLEARGLSKLYYGYITRLYPAVAEMCSWGIPLSEPRLLSLRAEVSGEIEGLLTSLRGQEGAATLNPRSPAQVKAYLKGKGYSVPKKYDSATKQYKESTDEKSLKKLRMKHPEDESLSLLLRLAKLGKAHSSYLTFGYDADKRMRFSLTAGGTETMRMAGHCDPWDNGVNPQTIPGGGKGINIKSLFEAAEGHTFLQIDLKQAESRFVAYDSADLALITCLEDPTRDIHKEVAAEIFGIPVTEVTKQQRQLGKKSGHGANYSMKELTFIDSCISELDLVLSKSEANKILEAYHKLFPGIRRWHEGIRRELGQTRKLATPWGWHRTFWGRLDDDMFRQAYAYRPQSTIPYIVNQLMLHLLDCRVADRFDFRLLLQGHDSLLLEVPEGDAVSCIVQAANKLSDWQKGFDLPGGKLIIPVSCEVGTNLGGLCEYQG